MELDAKIESLLFFKGEPMSVKKIAEILSVNEEDIRNALVNLRNRQINTGLTIIENESDVSLGTNKDASIFIEKLRKEELSRDLTKSALETLSIILYKNKATRHEIDYIRGVNSSFILRNLLIRGLIEKNIDPNDNRRYSYSPTIDTLQFMGISSLKELPDYDNVVKNLQGALKGEAEENNE
jgi:segregation and condensation protein B